MSSQQVSTFSTRYFADSRDVCPSTFKEFLPTQSVIGSPITALSFNEQIQLMMRWAGDRASKVVCVANVHMLMEAQWNPGFRKVLEKANLVTPDGMPLVWMMKLMGSRSQDRVAGPDILTALCQQAVQQKVSVYFLGSEQETLERMRKRLRQEFPQLQIAGMEPLPFRPLTPEENEAVVEQINDSGAGIVFVSLGCPKQERWMSHNLGKVNAVMIGLGGAFPVYAGLHKRAPKYIQAAGMEWFYRLIQEPGRLWKRYVMTIPPFMLLALKQLVVMRFKPQRSY